jgi:hypothetical protein
LTFNGLYGVTREADKVFGFIKKTTSYGIQNMYLHSPSSAPHTYDFLVLTSLTHPRKIILVVLQIGK